MRELDAIITKYEELKAQNIGCVLATVVHVEGSSYRRAGARMLVDEFGNITGAISGGCLEGDALRKALYALEIQENRLVTYDTSDEDDAVVGAQLGCNGIIQVLFEPLDFASNENACEILSKASKMEEPVALSIGFNLDDRNNQPGTKMMVASFEVMASKSLNERILEVLLKESKRVLEENESSFVALELNGSQLQAFVQVLQPPVKLILVGAGNDAQLLAQQAELLGWKVFVTDGRPTHANKERFAGSCQVLVSKPEETLKNINIDTRTCFVLMSHNYNYDLAVLELLLDQPQLFYIGILGPLKKYNRMLDDLEQKGLQISQQDLAKIHAPVGLEIGAETPAEIGLSILAEIQSVLKGKQARPLKHRSTPIHDKEGTEFQKIHI
ncbi:XdhC family protein [Flagellimonas pelagia]|uniref:XdhC family protein n=1 Tax=Flagellimonas pelagia TaxID=2306998 RepID=A0A3A1NG58_9FLAO|nr:XdhC/CoxI family protein [Allomuricauda maritima]RIV43416.1 XdhC/CoxI family protein [Allomuricauda maritima]TXJ92753.1 XdhC family protein [Allomuricauda maritima]